MKFQIQISKVKTTNKKSNLTPLGKGRTKEGFFLQASRLLRKIIIYNLQTG
jgi:hypothetical protein